MASSRFLLRKNRSLLRGSQKKKGYMLWWHHFTGINVATNEKKTFFIEIFIINPSRSPQKMVFGQMYTQKTKEHRPSYVMIKAGAWGLNAKQIHDFYPFKDLEYDKKRLHMRVGSFELSETDLIGSVSKRKVDIDDHPEYMCQAGSMSWNLSVEKECPFDTSFGTGGLSRFFNAAENAWYAQGLKSLYKGTVVLDGETFKVDPLSSYGYADKNWGRDYGSPKLWLTSNNLHSEITGKTLENTCFAIGGGAPKKWGISFKRSFFSVFYYEGVKYEFKFSKFIKKTILSFEKRENDDLIHILVSCSNKKYLFDIDIYCKKSEMFFMNYESPDGQKLHNNLWSGGTGYGELKLFMKKGRELELVEHATIHNTACEYGEYDMIDF